MPTIKPLPPLSNDERSCSLTRIRAAMPEPGPIRIFAYGSLIWDPCFSHEAAEKAVLAGYRRAFNFWSVLSRGTPERPGLGLGLEAGGRCDGVLFRLAEDSLETDLEALWNREMHSAVYEPRWLRVETDAGPCDAISFVTNTAHGQYTGNLSAEAAARIIKGAHGENGSCRDYLASTVAALARYGIEDPDLNVLLSFVENCDSE